MKTKSAKKLSNISISKRAAAALGVAAGAAAMTVLIAGFQLYSQNSLSSRIYTCGSVTFDYPSSWHEGSLSSGCVVSNAPSSKWPAVTDHTTNGVVTVTVTELVDSISHQYATLDNDEGLYDFVEDKAKNLGDKDSDSQLAFPVDVKSIHKVDLPNAEAFSMTTEGGHGDQTHTIYYLAKQGEGYRSIYTAEINTYDHELHSKGMEILKSIKFID